MQNYKFDYSAYISKIRPQKKTNFTIIIILIILLMGLALFIGIKPTANQYFYFVKIDSFYRYLDASNLANEIQNKGGAGYVYFDKKYHVLASFYPNKKQAESVCKNLKKDYPNVEVFYLEAKKYSYNKNFSDKENSVLAKICKANIALTDQLYTAINNFDSSKESKSQLSINLENSYTIYKSSAELIYPFFENSKYSTSKQYVLDILDCSKQLKNYVEEQNLSGKLKYDLIKIVLLNCSFLNSI